MLISSGLMRDKMLYKDIIALKLTARFMKLLNPIASETTEEICCPPAHLL